MSANLHIPYNSKDDNWLETLLPLSVLRLLPVNAQGRRRSFLAIVSRLMRGADIDRHGQTGVDLLAW